MKSGRKPPGGGEVGGRGDGSKTVALCVTGSIAAYKAAEIARGLVKAGVRVVPVMTRSAEEFLGPSTLAGLCGEPVRKAMFDGAIPGELHVRLAKECDAIVVAPATADVLARLAAGRADDLVTALALSSDRQVLVAPAMHPNMWSHPATKRNVATLRRDGRVALVGPVEGPVASGDVGMGRMAEPAAIVEAVLAALTEKDLAGLRIVVSAGPTVEDVDPVRFLSNRSTGKQGFAIARRAAMRGAEVRLVTGPVALPTPADVVRIDVRSALSMRAALAEALEGADVLVMSAAVSDYRPEKTAKTKLKKVDGGLRAIPLAENPDLLAEIGRARRGARPVLVGFAVETADEEGLVAYARGKLAKKKVDLVVANAAADSFGRDDNRAVLVAEEDATPLGPMTKEALADVVLDRVRDLASAAKQSKRTRRSPRRADVHGRAPRRRRWTG